MMKMSRSTSKVYPAIKMITSPTVQQNDYVLTTEERARDQMLDPKSQQRTDLDSLKTNTT